MQENQALWRSRRSTATVRSKSEVKRLILKYFGLVVDFLMHISGLRYGKRIGYLFDERPTGNLPRMWS